MKLSVIGTGYLGTTHAAAMAALGHEVVGVDADEHQVASLKAGRVPFFEPGLSEVLDEQKASGRLSFTTSLAAAVVCSDVHFVCVGTPQLQAEDGADLRQVDAAFSALAGLVGPTDTVVGKSTVPVGTATRLAQGLAPSGASLVWNPEFLREGHAVQDTLRPDRIVLGVKDRQASAAVRQVYAPITDHGTPVVVTDFATAELVKVAANAFLATKISFINAMAEVCEVVDADVVALADAIGHDARIGRTFLNAGLGFGGGCLPKDIRAFLARARELGVDRAVAFLEDVDEINQRCRSRLVDLARELCDDRLTGRRIAVLGVSFKPDSDDVRDSPALEVACMLQRAGAAVQVYDPEAMSTAKDLYPELGYAPSTLEACQDADVVLHCTEWREFQGLDPRELAGVVRARRLVDGRNMLDLSAWRTAGWTVRALGRR